MLKRDFDQMRTPSLLLLIPLLVVPPLVLTENGHFSGGSLSFTYINTTTILLRSLMGWELGYGPCGLGCDRTRIGQNTHTAREQILAKYEATRLGNWSIVQAKIETDVTSVVNAGIEGTIFTVNEHLNSELESGQFNLNIEPGGGEVKVVVKGDYWVPLNAKQPRKTDKFTSMYRLQAKFFPGVRNDTGVPNNSPLALFKPLYSIPLNEVTEIKIATMDDDNDVLHCKEAMFMETGNLGQMPGVLIEENCTIRINASESLEYKENGTAAVLVKVLDYNFKPITIGGKPSQPFLLPISAIPVQFLVRSAMGLQPPYFVSPTPQSEQIYEVYAGAQVVFEFAASPHEHSAENIETITLMCPKRMNIPPSNVTDDPRGRNKVKTRTLTWNTTSSDIGTYIIQAVPIDTGGLDGKERNVIVSVKESNLSQMTTSSQELKVFTTNYTCKQGNICSLPILLTSGKIIRSVELLNTSSLHGSITPLRKDGASIYRTGITVPGTVAGKHNICVNVHGEIGDHNVCVSLTVIPEDPCRSNPCGMFGTCTSDWNHYHCSCDGTHTGINCDSPINFCEPNPCGWGECHSLPTGPVSYYCTCNGISAMGTCPETTSIPITTNIRTTVTTPAITTEIVTIITQTSLKVTSPSIGKSPKSTFTQETDSVSTNPSKSSPRTVAGSQSVDLTSIGTSIGVSTIKTTNFQPVSTYTSRPLTNIHTLSTHIPTVLSSTTPVTDLSKASQSPDIVSTDVPSIATVSRMTTSSVKIPTNAQLPTSTPPPKVTSIDSIKQTGSPPQSTVLSSTELPTTIPTSANTNEVTLIIPKGSSQKSTLLPTTLIPMSATSKSAKTNSVKSNLPIASSSTSTILQSTELPTTTEIPQTATSKSSRTNAVTTNAPLVSFSKSPVLSLSTGTVVTSPSIGKSPKSTFTQETDSVSTNPSKSSPRTVAGSQSVDLTSIGTSIGVSTIKTTNFQPVSTDTSRPLTNTHTLSTQIPTVLSSTTPVTDLSKTSQSPDIVSTDVPSFATVSRMTTSSVKIPTNAPLPTSTPPPKVTSIDSIKQTGSPPQSTVLSSTELPTTIPTSANTNEVTLIIPKGSSQKSTLLPTTLIPMLATSKSAKTNSVKSNVPIASSSTSTILQSTELPTTTEIPQTATSKSSRTNAITTNAPLVSFSKSPVLSLSTGTVVTTLTPIPHQVHSSKANLISTNKAYTIATNAPKGSSAVPSTISTPMKTQKSSSTIVTTAQLSSKSSTSKPRISQTTLAQKGSSTNRPSVSQSPLTTIDKALPTSKHETAKTTISRGGTNAAQGQKGSSTNSPSVSRSPLTAIAKTLSTPKHASAQTTNAPLTTITKEPITSSPITSQINISQGGTKDTPAQVYVSTNSPSVSSTQINKIPSMSPSSTNTIPQTASPPGGSSASATSTISPGTAPSVLSSKGTASINAHASSKPTLLASASVLTHIPNTETNPGYAVLTSPKSVSSNSVESKSTDNSHPTSTKIPSSSSSGAAVKVITTSSQANNVPVVNLHSSPSTPLVNTKIASITDASLNSVSSPKKSPLGSMASNTVNGLPDLNGQTHRLESEETTQTTIGSREIIDSTTEICVMPEKKVMVKAAVQRRLSCSCHHPSKGKVQVIRPAPTNTHLAVATGAGFAAGTTVILLSSLGVFLVKKWKKRKMEKFELSGGNSSRHRVSPQTIPGSEVTSPRIPHDSGHYTYSDDEMPYQSESDHDDVDYPKHIKESHPNVDSF